MVANFVQGGWANDINKLPVVAFFSFFFINNHRYEVIMLFFWKPTISPCYICGVVCNKAAVFLQDEHLMYQLLNLYTPAET